jgi:hypothetical protein
MRLKLKPRLRFRTDVEIGFGRKLMVDGNKDVFAVYQARTLSDGNVRTESTIFSRDEAMALSGLLKEWRDACIPQKV